MKKKISIICVLIAIFTSLSACQTEDSNPLPTEQPSVITTSPTQTSSVEITLSDPVTQITVNTSSSATDSVAEITDETMPFAFTGEGTGGDEKVNYYQPCNRVLDNVPVELQRLVDSDERTAWKDSLDFFNNPPSSLHEYLNVYSFIKYFNLSDEEVTNALTAYLNSSNPQVKITEQELDIILHGTEAEVIDYFASDYSIVVDDKIYCPFWIYTHTPAAYEEAGITPEMLQQKLSLYATIPFEPAALEALNQKIDNYTASYNTQATE